MTFRAVFKVTKEYVVNFESEDESSADARCEAMPVDEIERLGAGRVTEDVEILALLPYSMGGLR